jgi:hypothetical protein
MGMNATTTIVFFDNQIIDYLYQLLLFKDGLLSLFKDPNSQNAQRDAQHIMMVVANAGRRLLRF